MDPELRQRFFVTLRSSLQANELTLTPHAVTLLTIVIEAIADQTNKREPGYDSIRSAQLRAIETIPKALELARKAYQTSLIDGLMLLTVMPRFMSGFCPPFENPPNY
jgi:hypothetical protein